MVVGDIHVPHGATLTIEPGTRVLFNGFFTLRVSGSLIAEGTEHAPIFFTSVMDTAEAGGALGAEPMDWNHLEIMETGALQLRNCVIACSFDVLQSLSDRVYVEHVILKKNAVSQITVQGKTHQADTAKPLNYNLQSAAPHKPDSTVHAPPRASAVPVKSVRAKRWYSRPWLWGGIALTAGIVYTITELNQDKAEKSPPPIPDPPIPPPPPQ